jgi:cytochrome P450
MMRDREQALDFLPFGDGPGRCPGQHFNAHEFVLTLDALLSRSRFELAYPDRPVPSSEAFVVGPEPGRLAVRRRPRATSDVRASGDAPRSGRAKFRQASCAATGLD